MSVPWINRVWLSWAARVAGGISLAYSARYVAGGTLGDPAGNESRIMPILLLFAAVAYLVAWWREIEGGTALATIAVALGGVVFTFAEQQPFGESLLVSLPLFLSGGLFYLAGGDAFNAGAASR